VGLSVFLETEQGKTLGVVADEQNTLHRLLRTHDKSPILGVVDWYGDTIFNHLQMQQFLDEWGKLEQDARLEDRALLSKIRDLAVQCQNGVHLYLKFVGD
jgi:hypothetical protein